MEEKKERERKLKGSYLRGKKFRREKDYSEIFRPTNFVNCLQNFSSAKNFVLFVSNFDDIMIILV